MAQSELQETLQKLQNDCALAEVENDTHRETLDDVINRTQAVMFSPDSEEHREGLRAKLEEAVAQLEADHPDLALTIRKAVNILSTGGV